jgi:hypothetical protein
MCEFFDAAAPQQCREPVAEHVPDKSRANFCGYFRISPHAFTGSSEPSADARRDLDALFGDASPDAPAETDAVNDAARDPLEDLFKK